MNSVNFFEETSILGFRVFSGFLEFSWAFDRVRSTSTYNLETLALLSLSFENRIVILEHDMGMGKNEAKGEILIEVPGSPENQGSPVRAVLCLKDKVNMREIEEREDCFLLDFDPDDSAVDLSKLYHPSDKSDARDVSVVAVVGQVACRDYPHSRHLCLKYPFGKTPHETHCELCYCFVCDTAAPCDRWSTGVLSGHCHAFDDRDWKYMRRLMRNRDATYTSSSSSE